MTESSVIEFDKKIESGQFELVNLVEIALDSHTARFSQRDINIGDVPYKGTIKSISGIKSSKEIDNGISQAKTANIVFANSEERFQDNLEFQEMYNREILIKEVAFDVDGTLLKQGRVIDLMTGVIDKYSWDNDDFSITIVDIKRKIYSDLPKYAIQESVWPNAVDVGKPYPIIGGLVTKVPIFLVDNVLHKYLACLIPAGHTIRSDHGDLTFIVYWLKPQSGTPGSSTGGDWDVVADNNYTVSKTVDANGVGVFIIDFTTDMSGFTLSIDIEGIEDTATGTYTGTAGSLITNHADFSRFLFQNSDNLNVLAAQLNIPSFLQARRDLDNNYDNTPTLAMWIGEIKDGAFIMEDVSLAMRRSMPVISNGILKLDIVPTTVARPYDFIADKTNIISNVNITKKRITDLKNDITINGDLNHSDGKFRLSSNKPSVFAQGEYKTLKPFVYNCKTIGDQAELDELAENLRDFEKDLTFIASFTVNSSGLKLKSSDIIALTYEGAPGKSFDVYDSAWTYDDKIFFFDINQHVGWNRERGRILLITKNKTSVDLEIEIFKN